MSRRPRRSLKKNPMVMLVAAVIAAAVFLVSQYAKVTDRPGRAASDADLANTYGAVLVDRVVDGDTLKLADNRRVRLIGIDTPEMHDSEKLYRDSRRSGQDAAAIKALGRRSHQFTKGLVEGKTIRLEFDVEKKDKYGRLLAYAYLADGTFVNAQIIKEGYASVMTYPPNVKHAEEFLRLYRQARDDRAGLWKE